MSSTTPTPSRPRNRQPQQMRIRPLPQSHIQQTYPNKRTMQPRYTPSDAVPARVSDEIPWRFPDQEAPCKSFWSNLKESIVSVFQCCFARKEHKAEQGRHSGSYDEPNALQAPAVVHGRALRYDSSSSEFSGLPDRDDPPVSAAANVNIFQYQERSSRTRDRDLPTASFSTTSEEALSTRGLAISRIEAIEKLPDLTLIQQEAKRTIEDIEQSILPEGSRTSPSTMGSPSHQTYPESSAAQGLLSDLLSPLHDDTASDEPCEAPPLDTMPGKMEASSSNLSDNDIVLPSCPNEMTSVPAVGRTIRYSRRGKKAGASKRTTKEDPVLNYGMNRNLRRQERVTDLTASVKKDVAKLRDLLDEKRSISRSLSAMAGSYGYGDDKGVRGIVDEVQSFVKDVNKVAQDMATATKRRSDLFVERVRCLESRGAPERPETEVDHMLQRVVEVELRNAELKKSLLRTRDHFFNSATRDDVA